MKQTPYNHTIYIIRHGETQWSLTGQHTGLTDIPLTENGKKQAEHLKTRLHSIVPFDSVFCSPLNRAQETCKICGLEPKTTKDLLEVDYGDYEGITSKEIHKTNPTWNIFTHGSPNGEDINAFCQRADQFIKRIKNLNGKVGVFTSGHFSRILLMRWLDIPITYGQSFSLSTASLSILGYEHNIPAVKLWNDTSHYTQV